MINKEAIEILKELPDRVVSILMPLDIDFDYKEAIDLAIKGLEFINENFPESFKDYLNGEQLRE